LEAAVRRERFGAAIGPIAQCMRAP
jgi:hypothetical protein